MPSPSLSGVADGIGLISGITPLAFDPRGRWLAVGAAVLDDTRLRYGGWLYDFQTGAYSGSLNATIAGEGPPVDVFQVAIAQGATAPVVFATYRVTGAVQGFTDERIAVVQGGQLLDGDLLMSQAGIALDSIIDGIRVSSNGRFVALQTNASTLAADTDLDTNGTSDIYLLDRQSGLIERVSLAAGRQEGNDDVILSDLTLDAAGTLSIAFYTQAPKLFSVSDSNTEYDAYVWRRADAEASTTGPVTIALVSGTAAGAQGAIDPQLSSAGVYFTSASAGFSSIDQNGVNDVWRYSADTVSAVSIPTLSQGGGTLLADLTLDGGKLLLLTQSSAWLGQGSSVDQLVLFDRTSQSNSVLSATSTGELADDSAYTPLISPDGRRTVFVSKAMNLSPDSDGSEKLYLHDALAGVAGSLSGVAVTWRDAAPVPSVSVSATRSAESPTPGALAGTGVSGQTGNWRIDGLDFDQFDLKATKSPTAYDKQAITSADVLAALKLAVGRNPNPDPDGSAQASAPAPISAYQYIAADADGDGRVTRADAEWIARAAATSSLSRAASWQLVPSDADLTVVGRGAVNWPRSIPANPAQGDSLSWSGVLAGDVDGSWVPPSLEQLLSP